MWIFKRKKDENGKTVRFKARLVAKGCCQIYGLHYNQTFSPMIIQPLHSISFQLEMDIDYLNVMTAFLNGTLKEEICMECPEGYPAEEAKVCRLKYQYMV